MFHNERNKHNFIFDSNRFGYGADTSHYPFNGGVTHSDDLIYLFPYPSDITDLDKTDIQMAQNLLDLWTSFAANSRPQTRSDKKFTWSPLIPGLHLNQKLFN